MSKLGLGNFQRQVEQLTKQSKKLEINEGRVLQDRWLGSFAGNSIQEKELQFLWMVFSLGLVPHISGDKARNAYRQIRGIKFFVMSAEKNGAAYNCTGISAPNFEGKNVDAVIVSHDFAWTMSFNHEGYGPFFTRREWVENGRVTS